MPCWSLGIANSLLELEDSIAALYVTDAISLDTPKDYVPSLIQDISRETPEAEEA